MPLSDEDKTLFHHAMREVKPLPKSTKKTQQRPNNPQPGVQQKPPQKSSPISTTSTTPDRYLSNAYHDAVYAETTLTFSRNVINTKQLRELKNGRIHWQAKLDLHGLRSEDAKTSLLRFLEQQHHQGNRAVLIIHGKGGLTTEPPLLKNLVNHWLKQLPEVLAFHSAMPKEGGTGALYVLLKRNR